MVYPVTIFAVLGIMSQNIIEKFKTCDELLAYLASCEIDQGVKYVHQRGFTQYHKSLEELSCGKFYLFDIMVI